jgi:hypothetical protein
VKFLAAVLGAVLIILTPLVHGSPIDPSTPGFWDDGDYDDIIVFLSSHLHPITPDDVDPSPPSEPVVARVTEQPQPQTAPPSFALGVPRAPPAA